MKPVHNPSRARTFSILWMAAAICNVLCALVQFEIWSEGLLSEEIYESLVSSGVGLALAAGLSALLAVVLTLLAYLASFDPHRTRRPRMQVYLVLATFGGFIAGYLLGLPDVRANMTLSSATVVLVLLAPVAVLAAEQVAGRMLLRAARGTYDAGKSGVAHALARVGLGLQPSDPGGELTYGLALAESANPGRAQPYLEEAYTRGVRSSELLEALANVYEAADDTQRCIDTLAQLYDLTPKPALLRRRFHVLERAGEKRRALDMLLALPEADRHDWLDTIRELLAELEDLPALRTLARELAREGKPFTRARECYDRLLVKLPADMELLEELAALEEQCGHDAKAADLHERIVDVDPSKAEYRRKLLVHYREMGSSEYLDKIDMHLGALVESGQATLDEKLAVVKQLLAVNEYARLETLVTGDAELSSSPPALLALATVYSETGRSDEALERLAAAHGADCAPELAQEIAVLESKLKTTRLEEELHRLEKRTRANPDDIDLHFEYLGRLMTAGALEKVVIELDDMLTRDASLRDRIIARIIDMNREHGPSFRLLSFLSDLYLREKDWDRVFETHMAMSHESLHPETVIHEGATTILRENPAHKPSLLALTLHAFRSDHSDSALDFLGRYYEAGGERTAELDDLEFKACVRVGRVNRATELGAELMKTRPADAGLLVELAHLVAREDRFADALHYLQQAAAVEPQDRNVTALMREYEERRKKARIAELRARVEANPKAYEVHEELGDLHHDFGQLNDAIVAYQRASFDEKCGNVCKAKLGYVLARKEMFAEAEEAFAELSLRTDQDNDEQNKIKALMFRAGGLMEDQKQYDKALQIYKRIFRVDAGYGDIVNRIEKLQYLAKKGR